VAARLERIALDEGDPVREGDEVARLHPLPLDARARAEAQAHLGAVVAGARAAATRIEHCVALVEEARRDLERARRMAEDGQISAQALEAAETLAATRTQELETARFQERAASFEVEVARASLLESSPRAGSGPEDLVLRSPTAGAVLRVFEECECVVQPGQPLLEVGDPRQLEVVVDVLSTAAVRIRAGAAVEIVDWGGEGALAGRVRLVEPSAFTKVSPLGVEEQRVNVIVDVDDPPAALADRYQVEARIVTWEADDVLKAPSGALFRERDDWAVFVVAGGRARHRVVEVGQRNPLEAEVRSGLVAGDVVLVYPDNEIRDGSRVALR
jgi:HlyD family secretion protein